MEITLKQAKDFWLNGKLAECITVLRKLFPGNEELDEIESMYNDNEKNFLDERIEPSSYKIARNKLRTRLQTYLQNANASVYSILYIASNPTQLIQLNYGKEYEAIKGVLEAHKNRSSFNLVSKFSAGKLDLPDKIKSEAPQFIYISLHGTDNNELMFTDEYGRSDKLSADDLLMILKDVAAFTKIDCIFFSACTSAELAKKSTAFIPNTIGMNKALDDMAGVVFAQGFFKQFFNDQLKIKEAFDNGILYLNLSDNPGIKQCANIPVFFTNKN